MAEEMLPVEGAEDAADLRQVLSQDDFDRIMEALFGLYVREHGDSPEIQREALREYYSRKVSDIRMKIPDYSRRLSDLRVKEARRLAGKKGGLTAEEAMLLSRMAGADESGFSPFDAQDDGGVTDAQLEGYAEHLRNYLYKYKDEAKEIDPGIDPEEEHAGPMAQDIEKVAPDCVKETPEGVKTVDGSRLSLVNAGVIGELARRVLDLEEKINGRRGI